MNVRVDSSHSSTRVQIRRSVADLSGHLDNVAYADGTPKAYVVSTSKGAVRAAALARCAGVEIIIESATSQALHRLDKLDRRSTVP